jgi:hypothetical protein
MVLLTSSLRSSLMIVGPILWQLSAIVQRWMPTAPGWKPSCSEIVTRQAPELNLISGGRQNNDPKDSHLQILRACECDTFRATMQLQSCEKDHDVGRVY